jgi:hypothetical protein
VKVYQVGRFHSFYRPRRPLGRVERYSSTLFLELCTRRRWGVSVTFRPLSTQGKTRYPLYRRLGGPQDRSGQVRKISPPPGFDPLTVQPVASSYTDCATRPTCIKLVTSLWSWDRILDAVFESLYKRSQQTHTHSLFLSKNVAILTHYLNNLTKICMNSPLFNSVIHH